MLAIPEAKCEVQVFGVNIYDDPTTATVENVKDTTADDTADNGIDTTVNEITIRKVLPKIWILL